MTQIAPSFQPANRVREAKAESAAPRSEPSGEGTRAALFAHKPTAAIYRGSEQERGGRRDDAHRGPGSAALDAATSHLAAATPALPRVERMRLFPLGSPLRLIGPSAAPAHFERETRMDLNRKDYLATRFHPTAKFSPLSGARITFAEDDQPFNAGVPYDGRRTTLPPDEHRQMASAMIDARLNRGPVAWGLRHGPIRV